MTAGDLIGRDRQAELDGVLIGEGTRFQVEAWDLFALPDVGEQDTERNDIGVLAGADTYAGRAITVDVWLDAHPDMAQMVVDRAALEAAFAPSSETRELHFRLDGTRLMYFGRGRGVRTTMPSNQAWQCECRFTATDPRVFAGQERSHVWDGDAATVELINAGTRSTPWRLVVEGPLDFPELSLASDPTTYTWSFPNLELDEGETLTIDTRTGLALVNGVSVIGQARDASGTRLPYPWAFPPGAVEWSFSAADFDGVATLLWRDAWA